MVAEFQRKARNGVHDPQLIVRCVVERRRGVPERFVGDPPVGFARRDRGDDRHGLTSPAYAELRGRRHIEIVVDLVEDQHA